MTAVTGWTVVLTLDHSFRTLVFFAFKTTLQSVLAIKTRPVDVGSWNVGLVHIDTFGMKSTQTKTTAQQQIIARSTRFTNRTDVVTREVWNFIHVVLCAAQHGKVQCFKQHSTTDEQA